MITLIHLMRVEDFLNEREIDSRRCSHMLSASQLRWGYFPLKKSTKRQLDHASGKMPLNECGILSNGRNRTLSLIPTGWMIRCHIWDQFKSLLYGRTDTKHHTFSLLHCHLPPQGVTVVIYWRREEPAPSGNHRTSHECVLMLRDNWRANKQQQQQQPNAEYMLVTQKAKKSSY